MGIPVTRDIKDLQLAEVAKFLRQTKELIVSQEKDSQFAASANLEICTKCIVYL